VSLGSPHLLVTLNSAQQKIDVAHIVANRFLIVRNASVSDRLWTLVIGDNTDSEIEATWLLNMPESVWQVVRETVLKCT
jgi:hypothetical protein